MIRPATPADAAAIGAMHARSWTETYPGLVPDELLAEMSDPAQRSDAWAGILARPLLPGGILLAEEVGAVLGFVSTCPAREAALGTAGEVSGLYVLRQAQRRGLGRALLEAGARALLAAGHADAAAWALDGNAPAAAFYAATGATPGARHVGWRGAVALRETAWVWGDLRRLLR
jgi:GNAT superfamily N-acetyltransferase